MGAVTSRLRGPGGAGLAGGLVLAATVVALLAPFVGADPPRDLTYSNARVTDEGFNLNNARQRALFGSFATGDVDRSLTNGAYSAIAAVVFMVTEPTMAAGRLVSVAAIAVAVLLLAVGLAEPLGLAAALLSAAALAGANLALEYGRLGMVEPTAVALLTGGFVLAVQAVRRRSAPAGAGCGLLLAAAVSAKAIAVVPAVGMLGVVLGSGCCAATAGPSWPGWPRSAGPWPPRPGGSCSSPCPTWSGCASPCGSGRGSATPTPRPAWWSA